MTSEIIITLYIRFGLDATQIATTKPLHKKIEQLINCEPYIDSETNNVWEIADDTASHM